MSKHPALSKWRITGGPRVPFGFAEYVSPDLVLMWLRAYACDRYSPHAGRHDNDARRDQVMLTAEALLLLRPAVQRPAVSLRRGSQTFVYA